MSAGHEEGQRGLYIYNMELKIAREEGDEYKQVCIYGKAPARSAQKG